MKLTIYEEKIFRILVMNKRPLTTTQITNHTCLSWATCKNSLTSLFEKKKVLKEDLGNKIYWSVENG